MSYTEDNNIIDRKIAGKPILFKIIKTHQILELDILSEVLT